MQTKNTITTKDSLKRRRKEEKKKRKPLGPGY